MADTREAVRQRAHAAFLGLALGDALGATTEFMMPGEIRAKYKVHKKIIGGGWLYLKPGHVTDDTQMSLALAGAILRVGGWQQAEAAEAFATWLKSKPIDVGASCRSGIRKYMLHGTLGVPFNEWDAGNGALMRMLPAALFSLGDEELLDQAVIEQAHLTHNHPLSDAACKAVGRMVHRALCGCSRHDLHEVTRELTAEYPKFRFNKYDGQAGGYVVETLRTVFHYLFSTASFEECLIGVVNQGGDADTTGAIAGMIAGAFYGLEQLPKAWLKKLHPPVRREIDDVAPRLIALSPWWAAGEGELFATRKTR